MAGENEYIKYLTQRFVTYMDTPRVERKQTKVQEKAEREHWVTRWFGVGAYGVVLWWRRQVHRQR
ncbi:YqzE family protein [Paenibacillus protaetiae]|uniref:YqzE family protein n=1 Tax=Paenibacillus protaetiae TaxID=2509456 RepID=A0A4P6ETF8_9BACL|nr:YqzE family protein [Paenibacillus protaetiae]QAY65333.1 YqzE family protein [Paenibacillus protaetiae]